MPEEDEEGDEEEGDEEEEGKEEEDHGDDGVEDRRQQREPSQIPYRMISQQNSSDQVESGLNAYDQSAS